jgi:hypothetical protein
MCCSGWWAWRWCRAGVDAEKTERFTLRHVANHRPPDTLCGRVGASQIEVVQVVLRIKRERGIVHFVWAWLLVFLRYCSMPA